MPAEGVIAAARAAGRDDLVITTIDLGENVAISMAQGGFVHGLGAQRPYDQGVTEADLKKTDDAVKAIVQEAADFAQASPEPNEKELWTDILLEGAR